MKIFIFVIDGCPYCRKAINMLNNNSIPFEDIIVKEKDKPKYKKLHKMKSFPQIFIKTTDDEYIKIGGSDDLDRTLQLCNVLKKSPIPIEVIYAMIDLIPNISSVTTLSRYNL